MKMRVFLLLFILMAVAKDCWLVEYREADDVGVYKVPKSMCFSSKQQAVDFIKTLPYSKSIWNSWARDQTTLQHCVPVPLTPVKTGTREREIIVQEERDFEEITHGWREL
jgi:hypothetical protein